MRYSLLLMWLIIGVLRSSSQTVLPVYTMPDTVCRGEVINITNLTQGGTTYEWNFCLQRPSQSISGANIGSPAGIKNRPHGIQVFKEGNNWVGFVGNDAGAFVAEPLVRFNFGNSLLNTPTVTDLPNFGVLYNPAYIRFFKEGNTWYALAYTGRNVVSGFDLHVVLLSFGNSLFNTPTLVRDFTNLGGLVPVNSLYSGIVIDQSGSDVVAFISTIAGNIYRINFGNTITNPSPVFTNLGNFGLLSRITIMRLVQYNGLWYGFVPNDGFPSNPANCRLIRLDFGNSLLNAPTAVNLGNPGNTFNRIYDILPYYECDTFKIYGLNLVNNQLFNLSFPNGISSPVIQPSLLGNIGSISGGTGFSQLLTENDEKYFFVTNASNNSISRLKVTKCNNVGIPASFQYNPPPVILDSLGVYNVLLTVNEGLSNEARACKEVVVIDGHPKPVAASNSPVCVGAPINLSIANYDPSIQYAWSGPNGFTSTQIQPVIPSATLANAGAYILTATGICGGRKDTVNVTVNQLPNVNLGNDTTICIGNTLVLNATLSGATYLWSTGATSPTITVSQPGTYHVAVTRNGCIGRDTITVSFTGFPASFTLGNDTTYCGTFSRVLSTGNAQTTWSTGQTGASITVTQPGTYWAQQSNDCGSTRDTIVISQIFLPSFNIGNDTAYCGPFSRVLSTGNAQTQWSTGQTGASITVTQPGIYWAQLTNQCGSFRDSITLSLGSPPSFSIGNDTTYCGTFSRVLSTGNAQTTWSTGQTGASITVTQPGTYWAQQSNACGSTRDTIVISQMFLPSFNIGNDTAYCGPFSRVLSTGNAQTLWSTGQTGSSITVTQPGIYWAELTNQCGSFRDSIVLALDTAPFFDLGSDVLICDAETLQIETGYAQTQWSTGETGPAIIVSQTGVYWASVSNACGTISDTLAVSFGMLPEIGLDELIEICEGDTVLLELPDGDHLVVWSTGSSELSLAVSDPGMYWVILSNDCGEISDTVVISTRSCLTCNVGVPTAFTPNGDGVNDLFFPIFTCPVERYTFKVFSRWGETVFSTEEKDKWDGSYKNESAPVDVYVWYLEYQDALDGSIKTLKGPVTLLR